MPKEGAEQDPWSTPRAGPAERGLKPSIHGTSKGGSPRRQALLQAPSLQISVSCVFPLLSTQGWQCQDGLGTLRGHPPSDGGAQAAGPALT